MPLASTRLRVAQTIFVLISFSASVLVIGGLGNATNLCRTKTTEANPSLATIEGLLMFEYHSLQPFPQQLVGYDPATGKLVFNHDHIAYDCGVHTSLEWGVVAFEVFCSIIGILAVHVTFFHNKFIIMSAFSVATPLTILLASVYVKISYSFAAAKYTKNDMGLSTEVIAAGFIIASISNLFFLGLFGMEEAAKQPEAEGKQGSMYTA
jgi:hypothetical protein